MATYSTINERYIQDIDDEDDDITAASSSPSSSFKQSTQFTLTYELGIPIERCLNLTKEKIDSFPLTLIADKFLSLVDTLHFITDDYTVKMDVVLMPLVKYYIDNSPNDKSLSTSIYQYSLESPSDSDVQSFADGFKSIMDFYFTHKRDVIIDRTYKDISFTFFLNFNSKKASYKNIVKDFKNFCHFSRYATTYASSISYIGVSSSFRLYNSDYLESKNKHPLTQIKPFSSAYVTHNKIREFMLKIYDNNINNQEIDDYIDHNLSFDEDFRLSLEKRFLKYDRNHTFAFPSFNIIGDGYLGQVRYVVIKVDPKHSPFKTMSEYNKHISAVYNNMPKSVAISYIRRYSTTLFYLLFDSVSDFPSYDKNVTVNSSITFGVVPIIKTDEWGYEEADGMGVTEQVERALNTIKKIK